MSIAQIRCSRRLAQHALAREFEVRLIGWLRTEQHLGQQRADERESWQWRGLASHGAGGNSQLYKLVFRYQRPQTTRCRRACSR